MYKQTVILITVALLASAGAQAGAAVCPPQINFPHFPDITSLPRSAWEAISPSKGKARNHKNKWNATPGIWERLAVKAQGAKDRSVEATKRTFYFPALVAARLGLEVLQLTGEFAQWFTQPTTPE